jgi:hypothetical protein
MIERKTIVDQIEVTRDGHIQLRFGLLLVEDGKEIDCKWHRTAIEPGGDIERQIDAVNAHLVTLGHSPCAKDGLDDVFSIAKVIHTPERIAEFRRSVEEKKAALDPVKVQ